MYHLGSGRTQGIEVEEQVDIMTVWRDTCAVLKGTLSKDVFDRWISVIQPLKLTEKTLALGVANDFYHTWLEDNYIPLISSAFTSVTGREVRVSLTVDSECFSKDRGFPPEDTTSAPAEAPADPHTDQELPEEQAAEHTVPIHTHKKVRATDFTLNQKYTFESFVVGSSNEFAHAACWAVAQSPAKAYNPLFMYGGVGLGKTHLMQAIGNHALSTGKYRVAYLSSEAFTNEYIDALLKQRLVNFRQKYRNVDLLLIDDIQFLGGKDQFQEEFFHTFNTLFDGHKQIVLTCDRPANQIPGLEKRLVSRFEWGLATELEIPSVETRIAILQHKANISGLDISEEIITFIAERISSNVRRLEGALIRASSFTSLTKREITLERLEELLHDTLDPKEEELLSIERIQRSVAEYYDLRFTDMMSKKRPANIAFPRQIAMFLARELTDFSLPAIGQAFGKNHATVLHAWRSVNKKRQDNPAINQTLTLLKHRLQQR
ncbi:MAG: chromosomal replication initiator protein DnaA [Verrucomicrobiota bacterium]